VVSSGESFSKLNKFDSRGRDDDVPMGDSVRDRERDLLSRQKRPTIEAKET
jgi:hypothetical protein